MKEQSCFTPETCFYFTEQQKLIKLAELFCQKVESLWWD
jgi:hypothetical protein